MKGAGLSFHNLGWWPAVLALLAVALLLLVRGYRRTPTDLRSPLALGLKAGGFLLLALALLEPSWSRARPRPGANFFLLLADGSRSLRLVDRGESSYVAEVIRQQLTGEPAWLPPLAELYQLRRYTFETRLERVNDFNGLQFQGEASNLGSALRTLAERYRGAPVAGVLLFTDGNATDLTAVPDLKGLPPIYPVVPDTEGDDQQAPVDVALSEVRASQTLFEDAPVTIDGKVEASGQRGRPLDVELRDGKGMVVARQRLTPTSDAQTLPVRFQIRPDTPGLVPYRVSVSGGRDEATPLNNGRLLLVERPQGGSRILYVGGRPSWEYKFLRRALENDCQLQLTALVRMAPREPKFAFLTRRGETQNPLYRGFGVSADDAERFDEPVLVRLGTKDEQELRGGFPTSPAELFDFQAIIIDDLEAAFFTADQKALVERFVTERGGGLLMLGGPGSFRQGGYARTPIGEILPLRLDRALGSSPADSKTTAPPPVRLTLSREGWLEAWTRLRDNEAAERARLDAMPAFNVLSRTGALKPAATVLATAEARPGAGSGGGDAARPGSYPVLVAQRAGEGRTAAITIGDLWRWGLHRNPQETDDLAKFWRQTLRFLVSDVPEPVTVTMEPAPGEPGAMSVLVRARGRDFRPAEGAKVQLEALGPGGQKQKLTVEPSAAEPGVHEATFRPMGTGLHRLTARVTDDEGQTLGRAEAGLPLDLLADEHRSVRRNLPLLEALARGSGGALVASADLQTFTRSLHDRPAPVSDLETRPLWHSWLVLLLALGCFAGEWALRRARGVAVMALATMTGLGALLLATSAGPVTAGQSAPPSTARPHLVLVVGAAGAPEYSERFLTAARHWQKAAARGEVNTTTIGLDGPAKDSASRRPDRDTLQRALTAASSVKDAPLWLVLIGHGTFDGRLARFNLRGADATEKDLATWLAPLRRPLVVINTASASAPFLKTLAGPDRVLVTATRSGNEVNAPRFGSRLAEALTDLRADLDRDGGVSLLEAFLHASKRVETGFSEEGLLATEHALLEDNGDGVGTGSEAYRGLAPADTSAHAAARDGARARLLSLVPPPREQALPEPLRRRRDQLEGEVLSLRERRATLPESTYYARLERILYEIARLYQRADRQRPEAATAPASGSAGNPK